MTTLIPARGVLNTEYSFELCEKIEQTNCRKGCIHAEPQDDFINCQLGLLAIIAAGDGKPVPEMELHGNRYITCLKRQPPAQEPEPVFDQGPDLFEASNPDGN